MKSVLRFLGSAGIDIDAFVRLDKTIEYEDERITRLLEIRHYGILKVMEDKEVIELAGHTLLNEFKSGEEIVKYGEKGDSMFLISEGILEVYVPDKKGTMVPVARLWPGDCIGEMSVLTGATRSADVRAVTNGVLLEIKKEVLGEILASNLKLVEMLSSLLADRVHSNTQHATSLDSFEAIIRQKRTLVNQITEFFGFVRKII